MYLACWGFQFHRSRLFLSRIIWKKKKIKCICAVHCMSNACPDDNFCVLSWQTYCAYLCHVCTVHVGNAKASLRRKHCTGDIFLPFVIKLKWHLSKHPLYLQRHSETLQPFLIEVKNQRKRTHWQHHVMSQKEHRYLNLDYDIVLLFLHLTCFIFAIRKMAITA